MTKSFGTGAIKSLSTVTAVDFKHNYYNNNYNYNNNIDINKQIE